MPLPRRKHGPLAPRLAGARPDGPVVTSHIPEPRRRLIYVALAEARCAGQGIDDAHYAVARKFVLTIQKVEAIGREGFDRGWPVA
jgi:hypothetical protein